jgi:aminopeptidase N
MKFLFIISFLLPYFLLAQGYREVKGALSSERTCFDVTYYDLHLTIKPDEKQIEGYNAIHFKVLEATQKIQLDLFKNLFIDSVVFEERKLQFHRRFDAFFVYFPRQLLVNEAHFLKVYYRGSPSVGVGVRGSDGFHWRKYQAEHLVGVSCEIAGASLWIPCKEHLSDEPDSVRLHWTSPIGLDCISNGRLEKVENASIPGYKTSHWFVRNPINTYNITFYLGQYQKRTGKYIDNQEREREVEFYFLKDAKHTAELQKHHIKTAILFVAFCEQTFGEYAFWDDKLAVVETAYSGMEHQSCVAVGSLAHSSGYIYSQSTSVHGTLIHEIAHEWWGNAVSASDMADMWLHEGFATYTEYLFLESLYGKKMYDDVIVSTLNANTHVKMKRDVYANEVFMYNHIYAGGAKFLHLLRKEIKNDTIFFEILKTYYQRYKKKIVLTENFLEVVNEKTQKDWTKFFKKHLE